MGGPLKANGQPLEALKYEFRIRKVKVVLGFVALQNSHAALSLMHKL